MKSTIKHIKCKAVNTYRQTDGNHATERSALTSSLYFTMPFQPSVWSQQTLRRTLDYTFQKIENKLFKYKSNETAKVILQRLKKLLAGLNFDTHRKGLAVIIFADSEKVVYLNCPVRTFISTGNFVSMLDIVTGIKQEAEFYMFFIGEAGVTLYEYCNRHVTKVYEQQDVPGKYVQAKISLVITLMNKNYQKPVFVFGKEDQVKSFQRSVAFSEIIFQTNHSFPGDSRESVKNSITKILTQWRCWQSKFHLARISLAKKNNALVCQSTEVLKALHKNADGLMLIDKKLKSSLNTKPPGSEFNSVEVKQFFIEVERFIERGNCILIIENDLLSEWGGIVLLADEASDYRYKDLSGQCRIHGGTGNLF